MDTRGNPIHQRAIKKQFCEIVHDGKGSIDGYIAKLKDMQKAMEGTGDEITDVALVTELVTSLPKEWAIKLRVIEDIEDLDLPKLERILRNYQVILDSEKIDNIALATKGRGSTKGKKKGGKSADKKIKDSKVTKDIECWHCLQKGHYKADCPIRKEIIRRSKERKAAKEKEEEEEGKANVAGKIEDVSSEDEEEKAFMAKHYLYDAPRNEWIIDSGATGHMCFDRQAFETLKRQPKARKVVLGDDTEVGAYGIGTVRLSRDMHLEDVLYVPDFTVNLCSVMALAKRGYMVTFEGDECTVARDGQEVIKGKGKGLYVLQDREEVALKAGETRKEDPSLWHKRLGHLGMASVKLLEGMAKGIAVLKNKPGKPMCVPCIQGKQHKAYNRHEPAARMTRRLEMVHSDTCGPFRVASKAGAKSFVLFTDDFTRMVWCFFMKSKKETIDAFRDFKVLTERHSGDRILRFRCDNGRAEYDNAVFRDTLRKSGITYEPSAPYTQNQNGVSERMNRTIMEKARTMLLEACLPDSFWAEAVNTAVYLHNRSPTRSLDGKTPYEAWNGTKPDLSNLRVFGCDAYLHVPDEARTKLEVKNTEMYSFGVRRRNYKDMEAMGHSREPRCARSQRYIRRVQSGWPKFGG